MTTTPHEQATRPATSVGGRSADLVIRWSTAAVVVGVASVAAYVSYQHAYELVRAHGEPGGTARVVPLTVDGLVYASSMVLLDSARHGRRTPLLAQWLLGLGIAATLAANVAHGAGHGVMGAIVAAWPAVALVGSYELLMSLVRSGVRRTPTSPPVQPTPTETPTPDVPTPIESTTENESEYEDKPDEYEENANGNATDQEMARAQRVVDRYQAEHGRWVRRDELRTEMRCSSKRATELLRQIKDSKPSKMERMQLSTIRKILKRSAVTEKNWTPSKIRKNTPPKTSSPERHTPFEKWARYWASRESRCLDFCVPASFVLC